jgi:hypothetical protein
LNSKDKKKEGNMGLVDQMKYAKILYLADILEDIQNEMNKDYRCSKHYGESIMGIVKDLRETVAVISMPNEMECEKIEIKRIENSRRVDVMDFPRSEFENIELLHHRRVEDELLDYIRKNKLIRVRRQDDGYSHITYTASLIVGIEKQPYVPQEQPMTPVDGLAKILDEIDKNTNL